jgi:hypothetical protein
MTQIKNMIFKLFIIWKIIFPKISIEKLEANSISIIAFFSRFMKLEKKSIIWIKNLEKLFLFFLQNKKIKKTEVFV